jgi:hypothetical protein
MSAELGLKVGLMACSNVGVIAAGTWISVKVLVEILPPVVRVDQPRRKIRNWHGCERMWITIDISFLYKERTTACLIINKWS